MKARRNPALVLAAIVAVFLVSGNAWAQDNVIKLFNATPDTFTTTGSAYTPFGTYTLDLTCPADQEFSAFLTSGCGEGCGGVFADNFINLTTGNPGNQMTRNICRGGYQDGANGSADQTPGAQTVPGQSDCFNSSWGAVAGSSVGTNPSPYAYGVPTIDLAGPGYVVGGANHLQFDLIDFGYTFVNSDIYLATSCSPTPAQSSITQDTAPGETTVYNFGNFKAKIQNPDTSHTVTITATPEPTNFSLGPNFPGASCLVYQNGGDTSNDSCWLLQISCAPVDPCDAVTAIFANNFNLPSDTTSVPKPGVLKVENCDPTATTPPGCVFLSNQISDFSLTGTDPVVKAPTSPPGGYSFWMLSQNTPNNPFAAIMAPNNGVTVAQGSTLKANYSCTPANPVLTQVTTGSCVGKQGTAPNPNGAVSGGTVTTNGNGVQVTGAHLDTSVLGTHYVTLTATDSLTGYPCNINDPDNDCPMPGDQGNAAIAYTVIAPVDLAITKTATPTVKQLGVITYNIGITNLSSTATANPVVITDVLPAQVTFFSAQGSQTACRLVGSNPVCTSVGALRCSTSVVAGNRTQVTCTTPAPLGPANVSRPPSPQNGAKLTITVTVKPGTQLGGTISNTATVGGATNTDPNPSNNSAAASTKVTLN